MTSRVLRSAVLHTDDTPVQADPTPAARAPACGFTGATGQSYNVFDFTQPHADGPQTFP